MALPDIRELDGRIALATTEMTNALGLANSSARLLPKNTVCLSRTASVGFVTVLGVPMATSQDFVNWICGPELDPWFLANALIASRDYLRQLASGAIHKTIYVPEVKSFMICVPSSIEEQRRIIGRLSECRNEIGNLRSRTSFELKAVDAAPKIAGDTLLVELREKYGEQPLGEYAAGNDCFRDGPFGSNLKTVHYAKSGARVVRLQNVGDGWFNDADRVYVSLDHFEVIKKHNVGPNDVVVACLGDGVRAAGRACVVPDLGGPAIVKADCFRVRLPSDVLDPNYIVACLNSAHSRNQFNLQIRGATRSRINLSMLRSIKIPKAPRLIQAQFAARAKTVANAAALSQNALRAIQSDISVLEPALFRAAFSGAL